MMTLWLIFKQSEVLDSNIGYSERDNSAYQRCKRKQNPGQPNLLGLQKFGLYNQQRYKPQQYAYVGTDGIFYALPFNYAHKLYIDNWILNM